ncbi:transketolase family protein [Treponema sp. OMZ 840]|uniref:transketolase family protein n=1 Tax=Treponema sp. OMZ 840 TaxID=244313 RepID=UPI003D8E0721
MNEKKATRQGYGDGLVELGKKYSDVIVLDADLGNATGTLTFRNAFPERYIEAGIAEQNLIGMAAGFSKVGYVPFASSFAMFTAGRAFEIIRNAVAYSKANVKIIGSHSGITPAGDGGTHQCIEDIALMRAIPEMTVLSPCDYNQTKLLVEAAYHFQGPVYMRTSREPMPIVTAADAAVKIGKAQKLRDGNDICIVATGIMTPMAVEAAEKLEKDGIHATVLNIHTIKPLDTDAIFDSVAACDGRVLICEEANQYGGLGEAVAYKLFGKTDVKMAHVAVNDRFGQSGLTAELLDDYGITVCNILNHAKSLLN